MTRRVLVTGGATGIGRAVVSALAAAGYDVDFTFHRSAETARTVEVESNERSGGRVEGHAVDLADPEQVRAFCARLAERSYYGLVHNAGRTCDGLASTDVRENGGLACMEVNFWSALELIRTLLGPMRRGRAGRIVLVGSIAARRGSQGNGRYAATKAALEGYMRSLVPEVARRAITVNCVAPGFIETRMLEGFSARRDELMRSIPARRYGAPDEVAAAVAYLLSDAAGYVNGATLVIDGGLSSSLVL